MNNLKTITVVGSLFLLMLLGLIFLTKKYYEIQSENDLLYQNLIDSDLKIKSIKNKLISEEKLIRNLSKENKDLAKEIIYLKKKKEKIKYVTVTKFKTNTVTNIVKVLPESYTFYTDFSMPICKYEKTGEEYKFQTLPVEYKANLILTDDSSIVKIKATSLYSKEEFDIPAEITTTRIKTSKDKVFKPKAHLGIAISNDIKYSSTLGISAFQYKNFNFAKVNLLVSENSTIGISPVTYNFSDHLPMINNLSIEAGVSTDLNQNYFYIGLSTEL